MILENIKNNISHYDGFVHQIVAWMVEKCNFTSVLFFRFLGYSKMCYCVVLIK